MSQAVLFEQQEDCLTLTLNQPATLNALGTELIDGLHAALDQATETRAKLVVFKANGKGFSGGLDLSGLDTETDGDLLLRLVRIELLLQRIRHASFATAACVHGACYGAAADLVLACRNRLASPDAKFLMPGLRFGIVLGTQRLRDTVGELSAYQLLDRSTPFNAEEALATGFITKIADTADWTELTQQTQHNLSAFTLSAYAHRVASLTPDTRATDMQALVTSITDGSIKVRMADYVKQVKRDRAARRQDT